MLDLKLSIRERLKDRTFIHSMITKMAKFRCQLSLICTPERCRFEYIYDPMGGRCKLVGPTYGKI